MSRPDVEPVGADLTQAHTLASLARLDLLLRREALRWRARVGLRPDEDYRGLYVSSADMAHLLGDGPGDGGMLRPVALDDAEEEAFQTALAVAEARVAKEERRARTAGRLPPLLALATRFGLDAMEQAVVLIGLALELDTRYERIFAYLQDDVSRRRPCVDLVQRLLCPDAAARLRARAAFEPGGALRRWGLIELADEPAHLPLLSRAYRLDDRIVSWLLGIPAEDPLLAPWRTPAQTASGAAPRWGTTPVSASARAQLARWNSSEGARAELLVFAGRWGTGRRRAAAGLAAAMGRPLLMLDAAVGGDLQVAARRAEREARLTGALVVWVGADALLSPEAPASAERRALLTALRDGVALTVLVVERPWDPGAALEGRATRTISFEPPDFDERRALWSLLLREAGLEVSEADVASLAARYRLTGGQVQDAVEVARSTSASGERSISLPTLEAACRGQSQHRLNHLTTRVRLGAGWGDLVLPPPQMTLLRAIATTVRHRPTVYGDWGFGARPGAGQGVVALFSGVSGTGKTLAASVLAGALGLDLYKVDVSSVVSKYIGETEKNLERIFTEAEQTDAILFFDEADALFGKRSEVSDARDRYANIEVAYLLQRTESYSGLVVLASNLKRNLDEAFLRRLHFVVDFPFPEERERLEIWRRCLPAGVPREEELDFEGLAKKHKLSGGSIRNAGLRAAFLAAEEGGGVAMRHLGRGVVLELMKGGKMVQGPSATAQ